jgi:hypothetical protein
MLNMGPIAKVRNEDDKCKGRYNLLSNFYSLAGSYVHYMVQTLGSKKGKYPKIGNPQGPGSSLTDEVLPVSLARINF